jgi:hypothetical protein
MPQKRFWLTFGLRMSGAVVGTIGWITRSLNNHDSNAAIAGGILGFVIIPIIVFAWTARSVKSRPD